MRKITLILIITIAYFAANAQNDDFYSNTRKIDQFTRGFIISAGSELLIDGGLRITCKKMKPWKRKIISIAAAITINSFIDAEEKEFAIGGGIAGALTVSFLIPKNIKRKKKTKFKHYLL